MDCWTLARFGCVSEIRAAESHGRWLGNPKDWLGRTMAHEAAGGSKSLSVLRYLYKSGRVNASDQDDRGMTVSHFAVKPDEWFAKQRSFYESDCLDVLKWLHSKQLLDPKCEEELGRNVTHIAAEFNFRKILSWLKTNSLFEADSAGGWNMVLDATVHGRLKVLKWLHAEGVLDRFLEEDENIAHVAARYGQLKVLTWMYLEDVHVLKLKDEKGWTTAHYAHAFHQPKILSWLDSTGLYQQMIGDPHELLCIEARQSLPGQPTNTY